MVVVVLTFFSAANATVSGHSGVGRGISSSVGHGVEVIVIVVVVVVVADVVVDGGGISNVSVVVVIAHCVTADASTVVADRVSDIRRHHDGLIDYDDWWCCW